MREYIHVEDAASASIAALGDDFLNEHVVLTGQEPMRVLDLLKMLAEILGLPQDATEFVKAKYSGHYIRTPYAYLPKPGRKYVPPIHVDLGQGLLQLIDEVQKSSKWKLISQKWLRCLKRNDAIVSDYDETFVNSNKIKIWAFGELYN